MLFQRDRTTKSDGFGFATVERAADWTKRTGKDYEEVFGRHNVKNLGLTSAIRARNEVETVQRLVRRRVHKVADSARRVIHPREGRDAALRREGEREVVPAGHLDLRVDEIGVGERRGHKLFPTGQIQGRGRWEARRLRTWCSCVAV